MKDLPGLKYTSLATPTFFESSGCSEFANIRDDELLWFAICALLFAKLASANRPKGVNELSGKECNLGDPGGKVRGEGSGGGDGEFRRA